MASSRKPSMASTYVTDKRISQWEELMRKFSEAHKEQFKAAALDIPRAERSTKYFPTGSQYEGSWDVLGMSGYGVYTFPNGVIYEGDFEDGMFHGKGQLRYESGIIVRGKFVNGVLTERALLGDNMEYTENSWKYCMLPDRRFEMEYETGLKPGGQSNLTAQQPTKEIPLGYYDTGDGFYDPKTKVIYKYEDMAAIMRAPTTLEQQWIVKNCRVNPENPLGPCPDLYEEYTEPLITPESPPPPAAAVKCVMASFRTQSIYEDSDFYTEPRTLNNASQERPPENKFGKSSICVKLSEAAIQLEPSEINTQSEAAGLTNNQSEASVFISDQLEAAVLLYDQLEALKPFSDLSLAAELPSDLAAEVTFSNLKSTQHY